MIMPADKNLKQSYDLIVIGGGPAGLAAALAAKEAGVADILIIERQPQLGGILPQCIHNGFGSILFKKDMPGPMYANKFIESVLEAGIQTVTDTAVVELTSDRKVFISGSQTGYIELSAKAIVLAMGCREKTRAQIKLAGSRPAGVFTAGTVQRLVNIEGFMPGREFVILGSGDIGMIMARRLTLEGAKVKVVLELLPYLTGLRRNYVQCLLDFDIPLYLRTTVKRIIGKNRVEAVEIVKVDNNLKPVEGTSEIIKCDTLMLSVGLIPENELSSGAGVNLDSLTGGPVVDENMATSVPGIFAAGNVVAIYDLVDYVSQAGFIAGRSAAKFVKENNPVHNGRFLDIKTGQNVRSLVPQKIHLNDNKEKITVGFRVSNPIEKPIRIEVKDDADRVVASFKKRYARPAEMLTIDIDPVQIKSVSDETQQFHIDILESSPVLQKRQDE